MAETSRETVLAGRYVLEDEIGHGGMATVWRATDEVLDRPVAVKILHEHLSEDPSFRERFNTEALSSARLTHPNIVNVFDTGSENGTSYIVMELFEGSTLAYVIERTGPLDPDRAIGIMLQVLAALQSAHENGVVHRDVKPGNILVGQNGMVKITDLGIARAAFSAADVTTTGRVLGSVPYLSPEQVQGSDVDARADVYACGVVLYEMLTGKRPFDAETDLAAAMMRITRDPLSPRALRAGISRSLEGVVLRAMARRPEDRFQSAENMAAALVRLRVGDRGSGPQPLPPTEAIATTRGERSGERTGGAFRSWVVVPLFAVLGAAVVIVIGLIIGKLQLGGPFGIETKPNTGQSAGGGGGGTAASTPFRFASVSAFDPFGDNSEHDSDIPLVTDGNDGTYWTTENYNELDLAPKPGVGLLFDLGSPRTVGGFSLQTPFPGYTFQIRVGDDPQALESASGPSFTASSNMRQSITPVAGRYVVLWITTVVQDVDGGNRAAVAEFRAFPAG